MNLVVHPDKTAVAISDSDLQSALSLFWSELKLSPDNAVMGKGGPKTERGTVYVKAVNAYCPVREGEYIPPCVADTPDLQDVALSARSAAHGLALAIRGYADDTESSMADLVWRSLPTFSAHYIETDAITGEPLPDSPIGVRVRARFCFEAPA